jgi:hypothetical protein
LSAIPSMCEMAKHFVEQVPGLRTKENSNDS